MEAVHLHSGEEDPLSSYEGTGNGTLITDPSTPEETLEYLIKVFSRIHVEASLGDGAHDRVQDSRCVFSREHLIPDVPSLVHLEARINNPEFVGRIAHVASHVGHSMFHAHIASQVGVKRDVFWWLEDLRAEHRHLMQRPLDTRAIREYRIACLRSIVRIENPSQLDASIMYLASCGRVFSGAFLKEESEQFRAKMYRFLTDEQMHQYDELIERYLAVPDQSDGVEASLIVQEWIETTDQTISPELALSCMDGSAVNHLVINQAGESLQDTSSPSTSQDNDEESTGGDAEPSDQMASEGKESSESSAERGDTDQEHDSDPQSSPDSSPSTAHSASKSESRNEDESNPLSTVIEDLNAANEVPEQEFKPMDYNPELYEQKKQEDTVRLNASKESDKVFPKAALQYKTRPPTQSDYSLAANLVVTFRKARWRAPTKTIKTSKVPPGRLSSRAAVTMAAQRSMGVPVTAEPFRQTIRKRTEGPPPIVGMACDISGSMSASTEPMAQLMWACSRAIPRVGGTFAAVSFGRSVKALVPPGSKPNQVPILSATDSDEKAFKAINALTGGLDLLGRGDGVKILIISSDAIWSFNEVSRSLKLLQRLERNGVHIFWVPFQTGFFIRGQQKSSEALFMQVGSVIEFQDTSDIPKQLGKLIAAKVQEG